MIGFPARGHGSAMMDEIVICEFTYDKMDTLGESASSSYNNTRNLDTYNF